MRASLEALDKSFAKTVGMHAFVGNIANFHVIIYPKKTRNDIRSIEGIVDDSAANGIAVQADEEIEERGAVANEDILFALERTLDFLGKIEGIVVALLIGKTREGGEVVQRDHFFFASGLLRPMKTCGLTTRRRVNCSSWACNVLRRTLSFCLLR